MRNAARELIAERPARRQTPADLLANLERDGQKVAQRIAGAADRPLNRKQVRHIVGIERWGQSRLRVALGEPLVMDEYDGYAPAADMPWEELKATFAATRAETNSLANALVRAGALDKTVAHNQFGDVSVKGWLAYLSAHARREALLIR